MFVWSGTLKAILFEMEHSDFIAIRATYSGKVSGCVATDLDFVCCWTMLSWSNIIPVATHGHLAST
jgi:hypothetical protein